jgi:hypothetical protein
VKNDRHGKAKILTQAEIQLLFSQGFQEDRDRALFGIYRFSGLQEKPTQHLAVRQAISPFSTTLSIKGHLF